MNKKKKKTGWGGATERQSRTAKQRGQHSMFCFISEGKEGREVAKLQRDTGENGVESSPRIHCGWLWEDTEEEMRGSH